jgi:hypothetical protein
MKIVIEIEGGLVSDILTDESNGDIEVYVMDHDVEGGDEDRIVKLSNGDEVYLSWPTANTRNADLVNEIAALFRNRTI